MIHIFQHRVSHARQRSTLRYIIIIFNYNSRIYSTYNTSVLIGWRIILVSVFLRAFVQQPEQH